MVTCAFLRLLHGGPGVVLNVSSRSSYVTASDEKHASQGVVAIAFHPGGISSTKLAEDAPEWFRPDLRDTQGNPQLNLSNPAALPAATALYLTLPRAKNLSGRFVNARWDMEELERALLMVSSRWKVVVQLQGVKTTLAGLAISCTIS
ncbi:hypothetical protein VM1G_04968 [Cytospora mali]|uniref:Uncharacterized protein n=1 Tax=Cytospora mali TaxID=578113 RepID=A0A194W071_CYTMA|nr:hypothetical protein VM1G_04968 [Valsa mali]